LKKQEICCNDDLVDSVEGFQAGASIAFVGIAEAAAGSFVGMIHHTAIIHQNYFLGRDPNNSVCTSLCNQKLNLLLASF